MKQIEQGYVTSGDGLKLAYRRVSTAAVADAVPIVCCNGIGVSTVFYEFIERDFHARRPVIRWDYRGHGESDPPQDLAGLTMQQNATDLRALLDQLGVERAILVGHSMGCQVIFELERQYPERVAVLVPMLGTHGRPVHTFFDRPMSSLVVFRLAHAASLRHFALINRAKRALFGNALSRRLVMRLTRLSGIIDARLMPEDMLARYLHHMGQLDVRVFFRMAEKMAFHSVRDHLAEVAAPTLVVAATHDYFTPLWLSEETADAIPTAELLVIPHGSHAALVEQPELLALRLQTFLAGHLDDPAGVARLTEAERAAS